MAHDNDNFMFYDTVQYTMIPYMTNVNMIQLDREDTSLSLKTTYSSIAALSLHPGTF